MGEKFAANPSTGSMSVPIATSPGRAGFGPQLSLSYDSGSGNGPFGFGWSLALPSITGKNDKGLPRYDDANESDVCILSGAEDLVPEFEKDAGGQWVLGDGKHAIHDKPRTVPGEPTETRLTAWLTSVPGNKVLLWDTEPEAVHETMNIHKDNTPLRADHCEWIGSAGLAFLDAVVRQRPEAEEWMRSDALKILSGGAIELHRR
jgi:hypothetical protein